jgi:ankyrin repeat protein
MWAAENGHAGIVRFLLPYVSRKNLNQRDTLGVSALELASSKEIAIMLRNAGAVGFNWFLIPE